MEVGRSLSNAVFSRKVVSYRIVVVVFIFNLLSTGTKLISGGGRGAGQGEGREGRGQGKGDRITNHHFHADVFVYFFFNIYFSTCCGQKDILFQHSIIFYTETV